MHGVENRLENRGNNMVDRKRRIKLNREKGEIAKIKFNGWDFYILACVI